MPMHGRQAQFPDLVAESRSQPDEPWKKRIVVLMLTEQQKAERAAEKRAVHCHAPRRSPHRCRAPSGRGLLSR